MNKKDKLTEATILALQESEKEELRDAENALKDPNLKGQERSEYMSDIARLKNKENLTEADNTDNPYFVIEDNGGPMFVAGPFATRSEAVEYKNNLIKSIKKYPREYHYYETGSDLSYSLKPIKVWPFSKVNERGNFDSPMDFAEDNSNWIDEWAKVIK